MPGPLCDIVIPVWNQKEATEKCILSIVENTRYPYRIVIVDNGSDQDTALVLEAFTRKDDLPVRFIRNKENEGFIKAVNKGVSQSTSEYICILNNDTVVLPGWLSEMMDILNSDPGIGIVNPSSNTFGQKIPAGMALSAHAESLKPQKGQSVELGDAFGFCMLTRKSLFDELGLFDEVFGMGYFEDTDFSYRVKRSGYKCVRALASYVIHEEKMSFQLLKFFNRNFITNKKIFEERWGRPRRLFFILKNHKERDNTFLDMIQDEIKKNNWIYVASSGESMFPLTHHSHIVIYDFCAYFIPRVIRKILFSKKRFDALYCNDALMIRYLHLLKPIHRAEVTRI